MKAWAGAVSATDDKFKSCMTRFGIPTMAATIQIQFILQVGRDWFSRPLEFIPMEYVDLYVYFQ